MVIGTNESAGHFSSQCGRAIGTAIIPIRTMQPEAFWDYSDEVELRNDCEVFGI